MAQELISSLEPKALFGRFAKLVSIPRISGHEGAAAAWIMDFAKERSLPCRRDGAGNVIVKAPASRGREGAPGVILQAHMDMVPAAASGVSHDFLKNGIEAYAEDGWLKARGTSLGADDGLGVCTILAILDDKEPRHGPITAIFTVEEETTMKGALAITKDDLKDASCLINLDSEDSGYVFTGCAGSCDANLALPLEHVATPGCLTLRLSFTGFLGGHSGSDIALGRANAIKTAAQALLSVYADHEFFIVDLEGGRARNSIPSSCTATVNVPSESVDGFKSALEGAVGRIAMEYRDAEPSIKVGISEQGSAECALSSECTIVLLDLINALPSNALRFHDEARTLVETSCNLGSVRLDADDALLLLMPRSLTYDGLEGAMSAIASCASLAGADYEFKNRHDCWLSPADSPLVKSLSSAWQKVAGSPLVNAVIHAGLECARFHSICPKLQMASIGSTIKSPHSPMEQASAKDAAMVLKALGLALEALSE